MLLMFCVLYIQLVAAVVFVHPHASASAGIMSSSLNGVPYLSDRLPHTNAETYEEKQNEGHPMETNMNIHQVQENTSKQHSLLQWTKQMVDHPVPCYTDLSISLSSAATASFPGVSSFHGFVASEGGVLQRSQDSGATWLTVLDIGFPYYFYGVKIMENEPRHVMAIGFIDVR